MGNRRSDTGPRLTREAVYARGDCTLVSQVSGDATLVLGSSAADERGVEDEAILWRVAASLQRSVGKML